MMNRTRRIVLGIVVVYMIGIPSWADVGLNPTPPVSQGVYFGGALVPGQQVTFDGSGSYDTDIDSYGVTPKWRWDFDYDGSFDPGGWTSNPQITHTFSSAGSYTVAVQYMDNDGQTGMPDLIQITITETRRYYYIKDHLGSVRTTMDQDGIVQGYDDYYPFGLQMPGRSSNTGNPNDNYKFTGYEQDDEGGLNLYHANARGYDPVLGRFMQIDRYADKYPGISPYTYVLNNPVGLTDVTGDTVDISQVQEVYDNAVYGDGHDRAGEQKDYADMTAQERQAYWFMDYYNNGGAEELAAFDIGGEFETTNITFSFATESPGQTFLGFTLPFTNKRVAYGLTTFGLRNEPLNQHDTGESASVVRTSLDNIDFNVYLSPVNFRDYEYTARHEMGHVRYVTGRFLHDMGTPILSGPAQDGREQGVRKPYIPTVPKLIRMKNK